MNKHCFKILLLLTISESAYSANAIDLFNKKINDPNIKNAFINFFNANDEYLKSQPMRNDAIKLRVINSTKCLNYFIPNMLMNNLYTPFFRKIRNDTAANISDIELQSLIQSNVAPSRDEQCIKRCSFKIDENALNELLQNEKKEILRIESNYTSLMEYKSRAHPGIKSYFESQEKKANLLIEILKKTIITNSEDEKKFDQLVKDKKTIDTLEKKQRYFDSFANLIVHSDNSLAKVFQGFPKNCQDQSDKIYKVNCEKNPIYSEVPGKFNRITLCLNDFKAELDKNCKIPAFVFETL